MPQSTAVAALHLHELMLDGFEHRELPAGCSWCLSAPAACQNRLQGQQVDDSLV